MRPPSVDLRQLFLNGAGRIGRAAFGFAILTLLVVLALYDGLIPEVIHRWTAWLVDLLLVFSACCIVSKRLHDRGRAGWWTAFVLLAFVNVWPWPRGLGWLFLAGLAVAGLYLGALPGDRGFNRFGPAPGSEPARA